MALKFAKVRPNTIVNIKLAQGYDRSVRFALRQKMYDLAARHAERALHLRRTAHD